MYSDRDVIAAQATPVNVVSPISVIRVSGDGCWELLETNFSGADLSGVQPWTISYGNWIDKYGVVDDVMVAVYQAPRSYTGQDMFEVFCHGNPLFVDVILKSLFDAGVRRAKPGEFTMRAVLNGKMDLVKAESLNALIESKTRYQADLIRKQARGPLVKCVNRVVESILQIQAHIEATIDYGEEDLDALDQEKVLEKISKVLSELEGLRKTADFSSSMRRGFKVLITGSPNVGKSTLFNTLVKQERAIVTNVPGTTRDFVSEEIEIGGLPVVLIDSAGVRESTDTVEKMGIKKVFELIENVDLIVFLTPFGEDEPVYEQIMSLPRDKWLKVHTKKDLIGLEQGGLGVDNRSELVISAATGFGLEALEKEIVIRLSSAVEGQNVFLFNQRQEETVLRTINQLRTAYQDYENGFGEEVLSSYLNTARRYLGEITGETTVEDVLDRMFSNFCLGK